MEKSELTITSFLIIPTLMEVELVCIYFKANLDYASKVDVQQTRLNLIMQKLPESNIMSE